MACALRGVGPSPVRNYTATHDGPTAIRQLSANQLDAKDAFAMHRASSSSLRLLAIGSLLSCALIACGGSVSSPGAGKTNNQHSAGGGSMGGNVGGGGADMGGTGGGGSNVGGGYNSSSSGLPDTILEEVLCYIDPKVKTSADCLPKADAIGMLSSPYCEITQVVKPTGSYIGQCCYYVEESCPQ